MQFFNFFPTRFLVPTVRLVITRAVEYAGNHNTCSCNYSTAHIKYISNKTFSFFTCTLSKTSHVPPTLQARSSIFHEWPNIRSSSSSRNPKQDNVPTGRDASKITVQTHHNITTVRRRRHDIHEKQYIIWTKPFTAISHLISISGSPLTADCKFSAQLTNWNARTSLCPAKFCRNKYEKPS